MGREGAAGQGRTKGVFLSVGRSVAQFLLLPSRLIDGLLRYLFFSFAHGEEDPGPITKQRAGRVGVSTGALCVSTVFFFFLFLFFILFFLLGIIILLACGLCAGSKYCMYLQSILIQWTLAWRGVQRCVRPSRQGTEAGTLLFPD